MLSTNSDCGHNTFSAVAAITVNQCNPIVIFAKNEFVVNHLQNSQTLPASIPSRFLCLFCSLCSLRNTDSHHTTSSSLKSISPHHFLLTLFNHIISITTLFFLLAISFVRTQSIASIASYPKSISPHHSHSLGIASIECRSPHTLPFYLQQPIACLLACVSFTVSNPKPQFASHNFSHSHSTQTYSTTLTLSLNLFALYSFTLFFLISANQYFLALFLIF